MLALIKERLRKNFRGLIFLIITYQLLQTCTSASHQDTALYVNDRDMYPLQLWLREIVISESTASMEADTADTNVLNLSRVLIKYCVIVISIVPMMAIYPFIQKYMVKGVMVGAVKG